MAEAAEVRWHSRGGKGTVTPPKEEKPDAS